MEGEPKKCYSVDSHQVFPVGLDLLFLLLVGWVGGGGVNPETLVQWLGIKSKIKNKYRYMLILL